MISLHLVVVECWESLWSSTIIGNWIIQGSWVGLLSISLHLFILKWWESFWSRSVVGWFRMMVIIYVSGLSVGLDWLIFEWWECTWSRSIVGGNSIVVSKWSVLSLGIGTDCVVVERWVRLLRNSVVLWSSF